MPGRATKYAWMNIFYKYKRKKVKFLYYIFTCYYQLKRVSVFLQTS